jgi:transcriptional antiterminator RfaH
MPYWACAQLEAHRERLALHALDLAGYTTYLPRMLIQRSAVAGRKATEASAPLFPGYAFVSIELQWHAARWSPGVVRLILDGDHPARVPDAVIAELRRREVNGLVVLPKAPWLKPGDKVQITHGPFNMHLAIFQGMRSRQRVEVLLTVLGSQQRITLPRKDIRAL